jgi:hypothetical protein
MRPVAARRIFAGRGKRLAVALLMAGAASACAPVVGDLGRPAPSFANTHVWPPLGYAAAALRGEQVSPFHLTDDEKELRDRAWRFVMPAHERSWFQREVQYLAYARVLPVRLQSGDVSSYHAALLSEAFRSEVSRYRRLAEDAVADRKLIGPFRDLAERIHAADRVRQQTVALAGDLTLTQQEGAEARIAENDGLIAWVRERLRFRIASYRRALTDLVVELPSREAVAAERAIEALAAELKRLDALRLEVQLLAPGDPEPPMILKH